MAVRWAGCSRCRSESGSDLPGSHSAPFCGLAGKAGALSLRTWLAAAACAFAFCLLAARAGPVIAHETAQSGPAPVAADPDPLARLEDENPKYAANKRLVFDMWRSIVNAGRVELAETMLQEDYIQHSPVLPTGRQGFKQVFSAVPRTPIPDLVSPPLVAILVEGDLVVMALREAVPDPDGAELYTTTHFNLFRIEEGRLAEHWHSVVTPPGPEVLSPEQGGPQPIVGAEGAAQIDLVDAASAALMANKRLVFDAWRQLFEGRRMELAPLYLAPDFIDHDPNGASGLASFTRHFAENGEAPIPSTVSGMLVALVADGDLVVMVRGHEHPYPTRAGAAYTTASFQMFRIAEGRIAERWSGDFRQPHSGEEE